MQPRHLFAMSPTFAKIIASSRRAAPYLAIELILPGGSLIALILWLFRNRASLHAGLARGAGLGSQFVAALRPSAASSS